jgi:hypothetical protein
MKAINSQAWAAAYNPNYIDSKNKEYSRYKGQNQELKFWIRLLGLSTRKTMVNSSNVKHFYAQAGISK